MLTHLSTSEGLSQQELAGRQTIHRNVMVDLVDDLERRGLVERRRHPNDRRAYAAQLTDSGRELLRRAEQIADEHDAELIDETNHPTLVRLLQATAERVGLHHDVHPGLQGAAGPTPPTASTQHTTP